MTSSDKISGIKERYKRSWFYFRLPGSKTVWGCPEAVSLLGLTPGGLALFPFQNPGPDGAMTLVPAPGHTLIKDAILPADLQPIFDYLLDSETTTREDHREGVERIVEALEGNGKTVLARVIRVDGTTDIRGTFASLCEAYPSAFIFTFSSLLCGTWIGASPELLLSIKDDNLHTMSLAGTRPAGTGGEWDVKNREEQALVTRYITSTLSAHSLPVVVSPTVTRQAGPVEHICTEITATGASRLTEDNAEKLAALLTDLSPTPAVCGSNRLHSLVLIQEVEKFKRSYYGGFVGPYLLNLPTGERVTELYVNLRSAYIDTNGITLFTGSGITPLSTPDDEWEETERKASTLLSRLKFIEKR